MIIALSSNKSWYSYLTVCLNSIIRHTKKLKKIYLFLETVNYNDVPYLDKMIKKYNNIEFVLIDANKVIKEKIMDDYINKNTVYTDFALIKCMLSSYVIEDKVLYLDVDLVVRKDISNLWNYHIQDLYIGAVRDFGIYINESKETKDIQSSYINSGVILFNLKKMREDSVEEKILDLLNNKKLTYPDQDAINIVCYGKILYLPSMYNFAENITMNVYNHDLIKVFHYADTKKNWVVNRHYAEEWYDEEEIFYIEFERDDNHD